MIEIIDPNKVFDKISFQEDVDHLESPEIYFPYGDGKVIAFSMKHFKKYALRNKTRLNEADAKIIDKYVDELNKEDYNSFLDFYCPKRKDAVRIYYLAWAGGRFTSGYDIKFIVRLYPSEKVHI